MKSLIPDVYEAYRLQQIGARMQNNQGNMQLQRNGNAIWRQGFVQGAAQGSDYFIETTHDLDEKIGKIYLTNSDEDTANVLTKEKLSFKPNELFKDQKKDYKMNKANVNMAFYSNKEKTAVRTDDMGLPYFTLVRDDRKITVRRIAGLQKKGEFDKDTLFGFESSI